MVVSFTIIIKHTIHKKIQMSTQLRISPRNSVKSKCHVSYMKKLKHAREFIISDVRMCINAPPGHFTKKKESIQESIKMHASTAWLNTLSRHFDVTNQ